MFHHQGMIGSVIYFLHESLFCFLNYNLQKRRKKKQIIIKRKFSKIETQFRVHEESSDKKEIFRLLINFVVVAV